MSKQLLENPSVLEYAKNHAESTFISEKQGGDRRPFGVNTDRFTSKDNVGPDMGTYELPEACKIKESDKPHGSMRSKVQKGLNMVIGKDNPGVGEYDTQHHKTIANKEF